MSVCVHTGGMHGNVNHWDPVSLMGFPWEREWKCWWEWELMWAGLVLACDGATELVSVPSGINGSDSCNISFILHSKVQSPTDWYSQSLTTLLTAIDHKRRQHVAEQSLIYEDDLAYQPDGRLAVDANASRAYDIPDKGPRPCGGWENPAGTSVFTMSFPFPSLCLQ